MKFKVTYRTETGWLTSGIIESTLDEARVTAMDELPCCCEIENIEEIDE